MIILVLQEQRLGRNWTGTAYFKNLFKNELKVNTVLQKVWKKKSAQRLYLFIKLIFFNAHIILL